MMTSELDLRKETLEHPVIERSIDNPQDVEELPNMKVTDVEERPDMEVVDVEELPKVKVITAEERSAIKIDDAAEVPTRD